MSGVLTVSANGVETSPVTRGVWVLDNILGNPPPPPPDEVPAIDTDVSGAKTIRERLAQHRDSKTCAECHRKIDPMGFPLENFDPIGRWREHYPQPKKSKEKLKIDTSGELPSGDVFTNFEEFKNVLVHHRSKPFTRNLIIQVLTYATGRHMETVDQYEIEEILSQVQAEDHGLRTLLVQCLMSDIFRSR